MRPFKHLNAKSLDAAVSALAEHEGRASVIAGGTDLLGTLKDGIHPDYPDMLVNIKTIPDLAYIQEDAGGLRIGALTRLYEIETHPIIKEKYGVLASAARVVASPQIRRMGTISGNICQEPRCWYYRHPENTFYCTRKDGKLCNALTGENQYHSIFGAVRVAETPCSAGCPANVDIATYMSKIRGGDIAEAARLLLETNPIPAITGRACPHFCEEACNRGKFDEAVSIRGVERFLGDYVLENPSLMKPAGNDSGKRVAIVGAGPAGLSAAYYLRKVGHRVTIFDRMPEPGGMLTYSIPAYRLPRDVVRRVAKIIEDMGVEFRLGVNVGKDVTVEDLRRDYDSLFLAPGAWRQPSIGLQGEELTKSGLEFLTNVSMGVREVPGRRVIVIGGGSVATDVGITALRLGAEEVTLVCLECREEMPAFEEEIEQAVAEGVKLLPSWGPARVLEAGGKVTGLEIVRCTSVFDENDRFAPTFDVCVRETVEANQIIMAVGQRTDLTFLGPASPVKVHGGGIAIDEDTQATNVSGIFAGGDVTSGRGTIVEAIAAGRKAAAAIDRYLGGARVQRKDRDRTAAGALLEFNHGYLRRVGRPEMPTLPVVERRIDAEDSSGFRSNDVEIEANRCFNCGCVTASPSDIAPALIALGTRIKTTKRSVAAEEFFTAGPATSTVLDPDELVAEIQIPAQKPGSKQVFLKYRLRKSIDFPIISVAAVLSLEADKVDQSRIVLGAAAPIPLRLRRVEASLEGKTITDEVAETAAALAVEEAIPLAKNRYKVQVTRALVRRAILAAA
jgi:NADPH-dependent glutamate synthase beta subunit-like oxidoreductase/CO/xanthine dehydrogenase FAD-binding subunit